MFEISVLKEMKLSELQEIAKAANITKITGVKKEALINQILEVQASFSGGNSETNSENANDAKPKRARITTDKKAESMSLFSESADKVEETKEEAPEVAEEPTSEPDPEVLKTRIETLDLSARTLQALEEASIRTIGGLVRKKKDDILALDGIGPKGVEEVEQLLGKMNLTLEA